MNLVHMESCEGDVIVPLLSTQYLIDYLCYFDGSVWVAQKPPGYTGIGWKNWMGVELSHNSRGGAGDRGGHQGGGVGGGRGHYGGSDFKCYESGESGPFAQEYHSRGSLEDIVSVAALLDIGGVQAMVEKAIVLVHLLRRQKCRPQGHSYIRSPPKFERGGSPPKFERGRSPLKYER